jgi:hypothetical protein
MNWLGWSMYAVAVVILGAWTITVWKRGKK